MDDVLADLSLNHSPDSQDGLLELSIGTDAIQADVSEQSGDISLSTDNVFDHVDDPLLHEVSANSLIQSDEDIYASLLICLLYTSPSPRDKRQSRMPSSA